MSGEYDSGASYYVRDRSHCLGPFDAAEIARRVKTRRIARHHQISSDGVEWQQAVDVFPRLFNVGPAVPPPHVTPGGEGGHLIIDGGIDVMPPPQPPRRAAPWALAAGLGGLATVVGLAGLAIAFLRVETVDRAIGNRIVPAMVTVKGIHPKKGKKQTYGILISRHHAVAPVMAASLDGLKVEARHDDGRTEWHSAHLVTADPISGLCVVRGDFGTDVAIAELPSGRELPDRRDALRIVMPGDEADECVEKWELEEIVNKGEPDEQLLMSSALRREKDRVHTLLGRAVVDAKGVIAGLVTNSLPNGACLSAPAYELKAKKKESGKLPADHVLDRIDLPDLPSEGSALEAGDRRQESPANETTSSSPPTPVAEGGSLPTTNPAKPEASAGESSNPGHEDGRKANEAKPPPPTTKKSTAPEQSDRSDRDSGDPITAVARVGMAVGAEVINAVPLPELPEDEARKLGDAFREDVLKKHKPLKDQAVVNRFRNMIKEICIAGDYDWRKVTLTVVEDPEVQAYAFVGGNIVINTGFIKFAEGDQDVERFVVGHELGHIVVAHCDLPFRQAMLAGTLVPGGDVLAGQVSALIKQSPLNQAQEEAADCYIVKIMRKKRWSTAGGVRFFERMRDSGTGAGAEEIDQTIESLFSSHPSDRRRIDLIRNGCE